MGLHIQDVEQVRGLGLAGKVDDKSEAIHSAGTVVVELGGVETVGCWWLGIQPAAPRTSLTPLLPRGSSLPHRCVPPWGSSCPSQTAPCHLLLLPPPGRQGWNSCKCPSPQSGVILQDPSNFTLLFYKILGVGPRVFHVLILNCTHKLHPTTSWEQHRPLCPVPFPCMVSHPRSSTVASAWTATGSSRA